MDLSSDYNRFLSTQLKIQKARDGFEVKMLSPIEFNAVIYLTYDLQQYIIKPLGVCPAFESIVIPIMSISSLKTNDPSTDGIANPEVHIKLSIPPFGISLSFPTDCRSFGYFVESTEFLSMTLGPSQMTQSQREVLELRKANEQLQSIIQSYQIYKGQQDSLIKELSGAMKGLYLSKDPE